MTILQCGSRQLNLSRPLIMGILNVTPDSFSDGGRFLESGMAMAHAERMFEEGAQIIDVGGESTRPGASAVSVQEELDRVIPVIEGLARRIPAVISVDTSKPQVMREAAIAGAGMLNDVRALQEENALEVAADTNLAICLMHMLGTPRTMQKNPRYSDVLAEVADFFARRIRACEAWGIERSRLLIDPGFGFGKSLEHNLQLLKGLEFFGRFDLPVLAGISRKSMIGTILGDVPPEERVIGSVAAALLAAQRGAKILRVHDVAQTHQALEVLHALGAVSEDESATPGVNSGY